MIYRNDKTGGLYELVGLVVDSNNATNQLDEAEILYRPAVPSDAVHYRRKKSEFLDEFTKVDDGGA